MRRRSFAHLCAGRVLLQHREDAFDAIRHRNDLLGAEADEAAHAWVVVQRREQMVGDGLQLSLDVDHWNSINPEDEPIVVPLDFTEDVEWRKNSPDDERKAG